MASSTKRRSWTWDPTWQRTEGCLARKRRQVLEAPAGRTGPLRHGETRPVGRRPGEIQPGGTRPGGTRPGEASPGPQTVGEASLLAFWRAALAVALAGLVGCTLPTAPGGGRGGASGPPLDLREEGPSGSEAGTQEGGADAAAFEGLRRPGTGAEDGGARPSTDGGAEDAAREATDPTPGAEDAGRSAGSSARPAPGEDAGAMDPEDPVHPDEEGRIEPWPPVSDCAELQTIGCHSHYACDREDRCEPVNGDLKCCVPGPRGRGDLDDPCPNGGVVDCRSGVCVGEGEAARCSLRCGQPLDCPPGLRRCDPHPEVPDGAGWCQPDAGPGCAPPTPGRLRVEEVLAFAPSPERQHEFIELLNPGPEPVDLTDVSLWSNRGEGQTERARFYGGCLPAGARVAVFEDAAAWRWSALSQPPAEALTRPFGLSNTADVWVTLRDGEGQVIDEARASWSLLSRGVSLNRETEEPGAPLVPHDRLSLRPSSPGEAP